MPINEISLLKRFVSNGDAEAFTEIVNQHASMVYGACLRILENKDQAADAVQDTFLQLVRRAESVTESLPSWLHKVAVNRAKELIRTDSLRKQREIKYTANQQKYNTQYETASWHEISACIDEELEILDDQTREVLILHFFEGMTMVNIAEKCGTSQQTVSRRIESGVELLRLKLKSKGVLVPEAILTTMLTENTVNATPAFVIKELGKIAIAGSQTVATSTGSNIIWRVLASFANKAKIIITASAIIILVGFAAIYYKADHQTTASTQPVESGTEILKYLQDFDSLYRSGFTISGTYRRDSFEKKWKITTSNEKIAYEEEVINILKLPDEAKGRWYPLRRTWLITPKLQAEHSFVGRIYEVGKLPPWPENSPGTATSGKLDIADPDAPSYIFPIKKALWSLGRGYSEYITQITNVTQLENGLLSVTAEGTDVSNRPGARWELLIDPDAAYMVREAKLYPAGDNKLFVSVVNSGTKWVGSLCVPEQTQLKEPLVGTRATEHLSKTVSNSTDEAFLEYVELALKRPYLVHTDIVDHRMSPELRLSYNAGSLFPTGSKDQEQDILFDSLEQSRHNISQEQASESNKEQEDKQESNLNQEQKESLP